MATITLLVLVGIHYCKLGPKPLTVTTGDNDNYTRALSYSFIALLRSACLSQVMGTLLQSSNQHLLLSFGLMKPKPIFIDDLYLEGG